MHFINHLHDGTSFFVTPTVAFHYAECCTGYTCLSVAWLFWEVQFIAEL